MSTAISHTSPYSGSWYPEDASELTNLLDSRFEESARRMGGALFPQAAGFVVPHAGLVYSGTVAAAVYRHIELQQPERVILLGFPHRGGPPGLWIPNIEVIYTPLGAVEIDLETVEELTQHAHFRRLAETRLCDHSVELQLPFLQRAAPKARVIPIYVCHPSAEARQASARQIADLMGPRDVLVASSDFTHFGRDFHFQPFPADGQTPARLRDLDETVIEAAGSLREEMFFEALHATSSNVCGFEPIGLLLATLRALEARRNKDGSDGEIFQRTLDYQTSGDITGDYHHCVSYGALGYFPYRSFLLGEEDQRRLLESAMATIRGYQETSRAVPKPAEETGGDLGWRLGAFVSLHKDGRLRGCVGRCSAPEPLSMAVPELTLAAALDDSRFEPLSPTETGLELEVSVLSPLKRIRDRSEFRVNQHGAMVKARSRQGLLLPQVATERGWGAEQFFDALARKAGIHPALYDDPETRLWVFRAQIFGGQS